MPVKHVKHDNAVDWTQAQLDAAIATGQFAPGTLLADIVLPSDWNANLDLSTHTSTEVLNSSAITGATVTAALNNLVPITRTVNAKVLNANIVLTPADIGSPSGSGTSTGANTGDQLDFKTISVAGQSDVVADVAGDVLTLVAGTNMTITTNAATDTITFAASGGAATPYSPYNSGTVSVPTGNFMFLSRHMILTGIQRVTLAGNATLRVS